MASHSLQFCLLWFSLLFVANIRYAGARVLDAQALERRYDDKEITVDAKKHDSQFFNFVTRPDIDAPRWKVSVYNESALSPGYWFLSPYGIVGQTKHDKPYVGPHIYDQSGELVWSGAPTFKNFNVFDFKVQQVEGKDVLTGLWPHGNIAAVVDSTYAKRLGISTGNWKQKTMNMHDFQLVDNGTRALYLTRIPTKATLKESKKVKYDGRCIVEYTGIQERDLATGNITFNWNPEGQIGLDESTVKKSCSGTLLNSWDYLHSNSIQKLPDGDYLMSGRRTYTLYKISRKTGKILWRLGGKKSDFDWIGDDDKDWHFAGQHDARCLSQNATHMIVSMMDNAHGPGTPKTSGPFSRGLLLSLRTDVKPPTAEILAHLDHPHGGYAKGRGNYQTLANGNGFMCWTDEALQSEHAPNGDLLMEAKLISGLKTYRSYKFPWVGTPSAPPDVHSATLLVDGNMKTVVHVSWNGATEVARWNLYKSTAGGGSMELVSTTLRQGFESTLVYRGYAAFVLVEGVDGSGKRLGISKVVKTVLPPSNLHPAVVKEAQWLQEHDFEGQEISSVEGNGLSKVGESAGSSLPLADSSTTPTTKSKDRVGTAVEDDEDDDGDEDDYENKNGLFSAFSTPLTAFCGGLLFVLTTGLTCWAVFAWRRKPSGSSYVSLFDAEREETSEGDVDIDREKKRARAVAHLRMKSC